jgi:hypothetical protein
MGNLWHVRGTAERRVLDSLNRDTLRAVLLGCLWQRLYQLEGSGRIRRWLRGKGGHPPTGSWQGSRPNPRAHGPLPRVVDAPTPQGSPGIDTPPLYIAHLEAGV